MPARKCTRPAKTIAEVPRDERPRERLLKNGAQSVSDAELLAVVLKNGLPWTAALDLTRELLADTNGLTGLSVASALTLRRNAVGDVQLAALLAAVELACRMAEARMPDRQILNRPTAIARYVALRYGASSAAPSTARPSSAGRSSRRACCAAPPASSCATTTPASTRPRARRLAGMIACVVADEIRPAIECLEGAARVTVEDLRRELGQPKVHCNSAEGHVRCRE
jgi:UPF0758 N-terminal